MLSWKVREIQGPNLKSTPFSGPALFMYSIFELNPGQLNEIQAP